MTEPFNYHLPTVEVVPLIKIRYLEGTGQENDPYRYVVLWCSMEGYHLWYEDGEEIKRA